MKESIIIRKLGPISNLEIPEIKQLTVLIGKSSTGKSAVMKTIAMMRYIFKRENIKSYLKNSNIKKPPIRTSIKNISKLGSLLTSNTEIIYKVTIESTEYTLTCKNLKIEVSPKAISKKDLTFIKGSYVLEGYGGYQKGSGTAYYFGDDKYVWFIESRAEKTLYRYRDLLYTGKG